MSIKYKICIVTIIVSTICFSACNSGEQLQEKNQYLDINPSGQMEEEGREPNNGMNNTDDIVTVPTTISVSWAPLEGGENEIAVINNSKLIVLGIVRGSHVEKIESDMGGSFVPFTHFDFQIEDVYAVNKDWIDDIRKEVSTDSYVDIRMTGDEIFTVDDAPLLEIGKKYFIFLDKAREFSYFIPVGGRLGMAEITNQNTLHFTSSQAVEINTGFEGKGVDSIRDSLQNQKLSDGIILNSERTAIDSFLSGLMQSEETLAD